MGRGGKFPKRHIQKPNVRDNSVEGVHVLLQRGLSRHLSTLQRSANEHPDKKDQIRVDTPAPLRDNTFILNISRELRRTQMKMMNRQKTDSRIFHSTDPESHLALVSLRVFSDLSERQIANSDNLFGSSTD